MSNQVHLSSSEDEIVLEIGSHNRVTIDKLHGPAIFARLRISCDGQAGCWVVEREGQPGEWVDAARIPAQLDSDFCEDLDSW